MMESIVYAEMEHFPVVAGLIQAERERQTAAIRRGLYPWDCADPAVAAGMKLGVLAEEFGEVGKATIDQEPDQALLAELVQVAAVASAWAESLVKARLNG